MGWMHLSYKPADVKQFLKEELTSPNNEVLDIAIVHFNTAYAAVKEVDTGDVFAAIMLLDYRNKQFGFKLMGEDEGPFKATCPTRILDLLTPSDYQHAIQWRARCREYQENAEERRKMRIPGTITVPKDPKGILIRGQIMVQFKTIDVSHNRKKRIALYGGGQYWKPTTSLLDRLKIKEESSE